MTPSRIKPFHQTLSDWYAAHGRHDLPWRQTQDPYHIYISEIMLQQTQVSTVLDRFYHPFLKRFPTLQHLADASEEAVLKQWQGLGYYSRARNVHKAAQLAAPELPDSYEGLIALPGIGQNTAHAILAFAFHKPYPVLEANVKRVIHRIFAIKQRDNKMLWQKAELLQNRQHPFDYNQAMMDVGAMICLPAAPQCERCPANIICQGKTHPQLYPEAKASKKVPTYEKNLILLRDRNARYYLTARTSKLLGGLYQFIEQERNEEELSFASRKLELRNMQHLGNVKHAYSHFKVEAKVYLAQWPEAMNAPDWYTREAIDALPLSKLDLKALALLPPCAPTPQRSAKKNAAITHQK